MSRSVYITNTTAGVYRHETTLLAGAPKVLATSRENPPIGDVLNDQLKQMGMLAPLFTEKMPGVNQYESLRPRVLPTSRENPPIGNQPWSQQQSFSEVPWPKGEVPHGFFYEMLEKERLPTSSENPPIGDLWYRQQQDYARTPWPRGEVPHNYFFEMLDKEMLPTSSERPPIRDLWY